MNQSDPFSNTADIANLTCTAVGNPLPKLMWTHDNRTIEPMYTSMADTYPPTVTLTVEVDASGATGHEEYTCEAMVQQDGNNFTSNASLLLQAGRNTVVLEPPY